MTGTTTAPHHLGYHSLHHDTDAAKIAVQEENAREVAGLKVVRRREERAWLVGRLLMGAVFIGAAVGKIVSFSATSALLAERGFAGTDFVLGLAIGIELCGGVMLALGFHVRRASMAMIGWVTLVTLLVHFDLSQPWNRASLMSNLAIAAGLLMLAAHGAGTTSVDRTRERKRAAEVA